MDYLLCGECLGKVSLPQNRSQSQMNHGQTCHVVLFMSITDRFLPSLAPSRVLIFLIRLLQLPGESMCCMWFFEQHRIESVHVCIKMNGFASIALPGHCPVLDYTSLANRNRSTANILVTSYLVPCFRVFINFPRNPACFVVAHVFLCFSVPRLGLALRALVTVRRALRPRGVLLGLLWKMGRTKMLEHARPSLLAPGSVQKCAGETY